MHNYKEMKIWQKVRIQVNDLEYVSESEITPVLESISEIIKMMVSFQSRLV